MVFRPVRNTIETTTDSIPDSPGGLVGKGRAIGGLNYFLVSTARGLNPVAGLEFGFEVESHSIESINGVEEHRFEILASNKRVAEFAAIYKSTPTNVEFLVETPELISSSEMKERTTLSRYSVVTRFGESERDESEREADEQMSV